MLLPADQQQSIDRHMNALAQLLYADAAAQGCLLDDTGIDIVGLHPTKSATESIPSNLLM